MGSAMVPLDRALLQCLYAIYSNHFTVCNGLATKQILTVGSNHQNSSSHWGTGARLIQCYFGLQECPFQMAPHSVQQLSSVHDCECVL